MPNGQGLFLLTQSAFGPRQTPENVQANIRLTQESHPCDYLIFTVMSKSQSMKTKLKHHMEVINTRAETLTTFGMDKFSTLLFGFWTCTLHGNGSQNYN